MQRSLVVDIKRQSQKIPPSKKQYIYKKTRINRAFYGLKNELLNQFIHSLHKLSRVR